MKFRYTGVDRAARKVNGELEASNLGEAQMKLREMNVRPMRVVSVLVTDTSTSKTKKPFTLGLGSAKPTLPQMTTFMRQLATMQGSGIPIVQALSYLADQVENRAFGSVLLDLVDKINQGKNLTEGLRSHSDVFDRLFINLVAAGEISGSLDKTLLRLAVYYEKSASLQRKIKSASIYPGMILFFVIGILVFMLYFVVPKLAESFTSNGQKLPEATQIVINISQWAINNWYIVLGSIVTFLGTIIYCFKNEEIKRRLDPFLLKIPLFGPLFQKIAVARFSRTLATMLQSGVPILEALEITARVSGNGVIEDAILATKQSITEGSTIGEPLEKAGVFPKMVTGMISVGEQTGAMDSMLTKIAEFYEDEVDNTVSGMTSILEPLMIMIVAAIVVSVIIPMYLPIMKMSETVGG